MCLEAGGWKCPGFSGVFEVVMVCHPSESEAQREGSWDSKIPLSLAQWQ